MITKKSVLSAVSGYVGGGREEEVIAAIRATPIAVIREHVRDMKDDGEYEHPENVVYRIASANGIYW